MRCGSLNTGRTTVRMRPLDALKHFSPAIRAATAARLVHARAASTSVQEVSFVTADRDWGSGPEGPEASEQGSSFRQLPINYAPETRFTVDNVAAADAANFQLHPSVGFWANYKTNFSSRSLSQVDYADAASRSNNRLDDVLSTVRELLSSSALADAESAAYWAYHLGRTGFFLGASASGAIGHHLAEQLTALTSGSNPKRTPFDNLAANARNEISNRLYEALAVYRQDLENIKSGQYKLPWDMTTLTHKQYNPVYVLGKAAQFVGEAVATLNRRVENGPGENWFVSNLYPKYYADNTFHYQSDGWFSSRSANVYEFSTESLFFGRQDAMQRTSLLPIVNYIRERGLDPSDLTLLEACCGTGRFHTFIKDNYPTMSTIAADLSPFYLAKARENVTYWKQQRAPAMTLGGADATGTMFMQCAAEAMPVASNSLDAVVCMYAFHEMPEEARAAAAAEFYRVLKPGGLMVLTDSVQLGDRPQWDATLGAFGNFNEPHYRNFIACDFGSLFKSAGFQCDTKYVTSATKTLSFIKPAEQSAAAAAGDAALAAAANGAAVEFPELN